MKCPDCEDERPGYHDAACCVATLKAEVARLRAQIANECVVDPYSSRMCPAGTKGCIRNHTRPVKRSTSASSGGSDGK